MQLSLFDIEKYINGFVDECLRSESPTQGIYRYTLEDSTLGETIIHKGSMVHIRFAAGDRDDPRFPGANAFNITRDNAATQFAFSHGQQH